MWMSIFCDAYSAKDRCRTEQDARGTTNNVSSLLGLEKSLSSLVFPNEATSNVLHKDREILPEPGPARQELT